MKTHHSHASYPNQTIKSQHQQPNQTKTKETQINPTTNQTNTIQQRQNPHRPITVTTTAKHHQCYPTIHNNDTCFDAKSQPSHHLHQDRTQPAWILHTHCLINQPTLRQPSSMAKSINPRQFWLIWLNWERERERERASEQNQSMVWGMALGRVIGAIVKGLVWFGGWCCDLIVWFGYETWLWWVFILIYQSRAMLFLCLIFWVCAWNF